MRISDWSSDVCSSDLEDNLFHADIHPGNIMLLRDSRLVLIDFGTIGYCERNFLANYKAALTAMAQKDFGRAADLVLRSEERRGGKECVSTCRSRWSPDH